MKTQFAEFEFDRTTGEITRFSNGSTSTTRLPPQPSQLLSLLISNYPEIVTHTAIQEELWPGIATDFESNLHFCIRQIRSALNDSASDPQYVETIPRRGYRWIAKPKEMVPTSDSDEVLECDDSRIVEPSSVFSANDSVTSRRVLVIFLLALASIGTAILVILFIDRPDRQDDATNSRTRIAIMPFATSEPEFQPVGNGSLALIMIQQFDLSKLEVIGPTTTTQFDGEPQLLRKLVDEYRIDLIVNGKFYFENENAVILAEVIQTMDGAHVWVKRFSPSDRPDQIVQRIVEAVTSVADKL